MTSATAGAVSDTTGAITSDQTAGVEGAGSTSNTATLTVMVPPTISIAFLSPFTAVGEAAALNVTITNPNATAALTGVNVTDTLPAGLQIPTPAQCNPFPVCTITGNTLVVSGLNLSPGQSSQFNYFVQGAALGVQNDTTGAIGSNEGGAGTISNTASVTVVPALGPPSPSSGPVGAAVTLSGAGFDPNPANDTVTFDTTPATVTAATATTLNVIAPNMAAGEALITVTVAGESSAPVLFQYTLTMSPTTLPAGAVASAYSQTILASNGRAPYSYAIGNGALPAGLSLNAGTGAITGTPTAGGTAAFTVTATDNVKNFGSQAYSVNFAAPTITVSPAGGSLPKAEPNVPYSQSIGAGGGTSGYTFAVTGGALPRGLTLGTGGLLSGTPTVPGNFSFTIQATDSSTGTGPYHGSASYTLGVGTLPSTVTLAASANPPAYGQPVTVTATVTGSGPTTPTGTVAFFLNGASLAGAPLNAGGHASVNIATLPAGNNTILAAYRGDVDYAAGSASLSETVGAPPATGASLVYLYQTTLGTPQVPGSGSSQFNAPIVGDVDPAGGHLFIADAGNQRVQVLDSTSLAVLATLGTTGVAGSDNAHFRGPKGVGFDPLTGHVLVADTRNARVQIFDGQSFAYLATLGVTGVPGDDNGHFFGPTSAHANAARGQLYIADPGNGRVQIFDAITLAYVATLGQSGTPGPGSGNLIWPNDAELDPATGQIMVADSLDSRVQLFDAASLAFAGSIGDPTPDLADPTYLGLPVSAAYDPVSHLVLVADAGQEDRVEAFDALTYRYALTLGTTGQPGTGNASFAGPAGIAVDTAHQRLYVGDPHNDRVQGFAINAPVLTAAILPASRAVALGNEATFLASLINAGASPLQGCAVSLTATAPSGLSLSYQSLTASNVPSGTADSPVALGAGATQAFLLGFSATQPFSAAGLPIDFACNGVGPAPVLSGVDTLDLTYSSTPGPDLIALAATPSGNGILAIPLGQAAAFALATDNLGTAGNITVSSDFNGASLPLSVTLCATDPTTGVCLATPAASLTLPIAGGATPTFTVTATATAPIRFNPAGARIFVRFRTADGTECGATSVAVETQ